MSSIKTTQIDGDVSVGRNVAMGGKAEIAGSAHIGHNLKVDGWLEAPNIKGANKGIFPTVQKLREVYPTAQDGWFAGVGTSTPFAAYTGNKGEWLPTGGTIDITADIMLFKEELDELRDELHNLPDIDDEPTAGSENVVKSGGVISYFDKVGDITFSGNGETFVSKPAFTAKAGKKYLIFPQSSIWDVALNTKSYEYKGYIIRDENDNTLYSVNIHKAQDVLSKAVEPFYFTPDTDTSIEIGIRAATGTIVKINVLDVTNLLSDTPNNNYEGFVSGIGVYNMVLNNINVLKSNGLLGRDFSFYWSNGAIPNFREQKVDDTFELIVTFPNTVMRVLDNHTGAKRKQFTPSVTEYTLPILTALVYNLTDNTFTIKNFGNNAPDRIDPENECIVLYNTIGAYGGALLPYLIDWKLNNILTKAISTVEYKLTDFQFGSVQKNGSMVSHSGFLYKSKFKIKPCSLSITAKSYTVNETVYYPYFRIAAIYKDGTYGLIVGGFNNADVPVCDNITINDNVDYIAFSIKYAQSAAGPIINTEGEDTLSSVYQDGDVVMSIAKTIDNISAEVDNLDERVTALEEEPEDTSIFSFYPKKEFLPKIATLKKLVPYNFASASTRNTPIVFLVFTDLHGDINNFKRIMEWKNEYKIYIDDVINAGDTVTDNHANYDEVMLPYFEEGGRNVLLALGNHDCCGGGSYKGWDGRLDYSIQDVYSEYTSLLDADSLGIVLPTQSEIGDIANYANFYYKDYTIGVVNNRPVRLFVLDSCITVDSIIHSNTGNDTAATQAYQDAQLAWFTAKLTEANTLGYDVAVVCHCVQPCEDLESSSGFTNYAEHTIDGWYSASLPSVFIDAVDSFINNGGVFISWLIGHTHGNHIAKIIGHTNQLVIGFNTATSRSYGASKTNPYRTGYNGAEPITETTDAFCMVQIDTYYKIIRLVNVGTDYDMYGRTKGMIAIDYNKKTILGK